MMDFPLLRQENIGKHFYARNGEKVEMISLYGHNGHGAKMKPVGSSDVYEVGIEGNFDENEESEFDIVGIVPDDDPYVWNKIEDKLPEYSGEYLVVLWSGKMVFSYFKRESNTWSKYNDLIQNWMKIIKPYTPTRIGRRKK